MIWIIHIVVLNVLFGLSKLIKKDIFFISTSFLYALFVFGQRWMTGTDFKNYLKYVLIDFYVPEPIYRWLQDIIVNHNLYFGLLIFVVFGITLFNNYRFILKVDTNIVLMIYLYFMSESFFAQMSQIRQFAAISFFINAYYFSYEKRIGKSFLNLLLGAGFHTSILYLTPFLFMKLDINRLKALYITFLAALLPWIDITAILNLPFFSRYSHYLESVYNVNLSPFHLIKFYILLFVVIMGFIYFDEYSSTTKDQMIFNGILLNMLIYSLSFQFAPMFRVSNYFKVFEIVFLIYFLYRLTNFSKVTLKVIVMVLFMGMFAGVVITDPYDISRYEFRHLRLYEDKEIEELNYEIDNFDNNIE